MEIADLLEQISENEDEALDLYDLDQETPQDELVSLFKQNGIANWETNLSLIEELLEFDLEEQFENYIQKLKEYTRVRSAVFKLILKAIEEDSDDYNDEIDDLEKKVAILLEEIEQIEL
jgi:hypothetical protein